MLLHWWLREHAAVRLQSRHPTPARPSRAAPSLPQARGVVLSTIATDTDEVGMAAAEAAGDVTGGRGGEL